MIFKDLNSNRISTAASNIFLGVEADMSLDDKLTKILEALEKASKAEVNTSTSFDTDASEINVSDESVTGVSPFFERVSYPFIDYVVTPGGSSTKLSWNVGTFIEGIPKTQSFRHIRVFGEGGNRVIFDSEKQSGQVNLPPSTLPLLFDVSIRIETAESGVVEYRGAIKLSGIALQGALELTSRSIVLDNNIQTQEDVNKWLVGELSQIKNKLDRILSIDTQEKDFTSNDIKQVVEELIDKLL